MRSSGQGFLAMTVLLLGLFGGGGAYADPSNPQEPDVGAGLNDFHVWAQNSSAPASPSVGGGSHDAVRQEIAPPCGPSAPTGCRPTEICAPDSGSPTGWTATVWSEATGPSGAHTIGLELRPCEPSEAAAPSLPALVLRAFQAVPLPEATLSIQPPGGKTLVGLETILSTEAAPFTRRVTLLGQQVDLRIRARSFTWTHGDATSQTTDWAGKTWSDDQPDIGRYITHTYEHTGEVQPAVRVVWEADYRVGGGAWQPVNGTVTRQGSPATLRVVEAEPVLNGY